jgi:hypothetical protein
VLESLDQGELYSLGKGRLFSSRECRSNMLSGSWAAAIEGTALRASVAFVWRAIPASYNEETTPMEIIILCPIEPHPLSTMTLC